MRYRTCSIIASLQVPYLVMLVTAGLPVFFLEIFLGQYAGTGPVKIFETLMPLGKGLGYVRGAQSGTNKQKLVHATLAIEQAMVNVGVLFSFFYIVVVSWALWYLIASFHSPLEWGHCNHEYNSPHCFAALDDSNGTLSKESVAAAEEYWQRHVLDAQGRDWTNYVSESIFIIDLSKQLTILTHDLVPQGAISCNLVLQRSDLVNHALHHVSFLKR